MVLPLRIDRVEEQEALEAMEVLRPDFVLAPLPAVEGDARELLLRLGERRADVVRLAVDAEVAPKPGRDVLGPPLPLRHLSPERGVDVVPDHAPDHPVDHRALARLVAVEDRLA